MVEKRMGRYGWPFKSILNMEPTSSPHLSRARHTTLEGFEAIIGLLSQLAFLAMRFLGRIWHPGAVPLA